MMDKLLDEKNVFITGAGANIGRAIALEMAAQGARIFFADKDAARTKDLELELQSSGTTVRGFVCDVAQIAALEGIVRQLTEQGVTIDVLVNNVGINVNYAETTPETFEKWQRAMDTNVLAPLYLSRLVAQTMIEAGIAGSMLFITSIHQEVYFGGQIYSATKASLGMVIEELAVSLATYGIRVNGIAPGACREDEEGNTLREANTPLHHETVKPCYIGRAAVFLASDYLSHHTTGATLRIDGGLSLYAYTNRELISNSAPPLPKAPLTVRVRRRLGRIGQTARALFS